MTNPTRTRTEFVDPLQAAEQIASLHRLDVEQAHEIVTDGIQLGRVSARHVGIHGQQRPAAVEELDYDLIWSTGRAPVLLGPTEADGGFSLQILVPTIEISIAAALSYAVEALGVPQPQSQAVARDRGGRPAEYDWRAATRQVLLRVREHGWPEKKAELIAELLDWFARENSEPPDESTVRRFVGAIWPTGRCELEPRR
jgi:hypothetical protein